ncbi:MAG: 4Fe-4S binding protein [Acidobacteriota bacterium]
MDKSLLKPKPRGWRLWLQSVFGINPTRWIVQFAFLVLVIWIGWEFHRFVSMAESARPDEFVSLPERPPGVEGFLPISGLIGIRHWASTGELNTIHPAATVLLIVFVAISWLLRKSFCSWICPVGALSEYLWKLGRFFFRRSVAPWRWIDIPPRALKYLLLLFFLYAIFWAMDALAIQSFIDSPYNRVADVKMYMFFARISPFALKTVVVLALLSIIIKNFWCRYLCPYGALLGFFSRISPTTVRRDEETCIDCGKCAVACPSYLPVDKVKDVRSVECTGCLDCVAVCPVTPALRVRTAGIGHSLSFAEFAAAVVLLFMLGVGAARLTGCWQNTITAQEYHRRIREIDSPIYAHPGARSDPAVSARR